MTGKLGKNVRCITLQIRDEDVYYTVA